MHYEPLARVLILLSLANGSPALPSEYLVTTMQRPLTEMPDFSMEDRW